MRGLAVVCRPLGVTYLHVALHPNPKFPNPNPNRDPNYNLTLQAWNRFDCLIVCLAALSFASRVLAARVSVGVHVHPVTKQCLATDLLIQFM